MPYKVHACPIQTGATAGKVIDQASFERLLELYYRKRGWDADGNPPPEVERLHKPRKEVWCVLRDPFL